MILETLSAIALRELIDAGMKSGGLPEINLAAEGVFKLFGERFGNHADKLSRALVRSNERAWKALEVALAGEGMWSWLDRSDDKAFRRQVRAFLDSTPYGHLPGHDAEFRGKSLRELRYARKDGLFAGEPRVDRLARQACNFARFSDPQGLLRAHWSAVERVAEVAEKARYRHLAHLLRLRPTPPGAAPDPGAPPLLVIAVRYFFRRAVESDPALYQGLTFQRMEGMAQAQEAAFSSFHDALEESGEMLEQALAALAGVAEGVRQVRAEQERQGELLREVHRGLGRLDVRAELEEQSAQARQLHQEVLKALEQNRLALRELRPRDSLSIHNEGERKLVKQLVARYRALPPEQQGQLPALLNALAKLEVAAGDYDSAQRDFQQVSALVRGAPAAEAEAHYNAYRTALEQRKTELALAELRAAVALDPARFAPFPLDKYEPRRILGAGGFGVAFLCRHRFMDAAVVVKCLVRDDLDQDINQVFAEAQHLRRLNHPAVIGIQDCGFADPASSARPYVVMDYFKGLPLDQYVTQHGPVARAELPALARLLASGLYAAHGQNILHRDVKPGNVLVRRRMKDEGGRMKKDSWGSGSSFIPPPSSFMGWDAKLIDFGLAMPHRVVQSTVRQAGTLSNSVVGLSVAGTLEYAAPEQMGKLDARVSFASDVYGFGRTCCYALFGTPNLTYQEWKEIEGPLADLLSLCLAERPEKRLPDFKAVLQRLERLPKPPPPVLAPVPAEPAPAAPPRQPPKVTPRPPARPAAKPPESVLEALPAAPAEKALPAGPADVLEVLPALPAGPAKSTPNAPRPDEPQVVTRRGQADVTVAYRGHEVRAQCSARTKLAKVTYDGRLMASGLPLPERTYSFTVVEDGAAVRYEVTVRGPGVSFRGKPLFTVCRNGRVLFNDR
jgi:serine/threonine protein kinase